MEWHIRTQYLQISELTHRPWEATLIVLSDDHKRQLDCLGVGEGSTREQARLTAFRQALDSGHMGIFDEIAYEEVENLGLRSILQAAKTFVEEMKKKEWGE